MDYCVQFARRQEGEEVSGRKGAKKGTEKEGRGGKKGGERKVPLDLPVGALKSRDLTTRHHTAKVDIARLVSVFE